MIRYMKNLLGFKSKLDKPESVISMPDGRSIKMPTPKTLMKQLKKLPKSDKITPEVVDIHMQIVLWSMNELLPSIMVALFHHEKAENYLRIPVRNTETKSEYDFNIIFQKKNRRLPAETDIGLPVEMMMENGWYPKEKMTDKDKLALAIKALKSMANPSNEYGPTQECRDVLEAIGETWEGREAAHI